MGKDCYVYPSLDIASVSLRFKGVRQEISGREKVLESLHEVVF